MADDDQSEVLSAPESDETAAAITDDDATPAQRDSAGPAVEAAGEPADQTGEGADQLVEEPEEERRPPHRRFDLLAEPDAAMEAARAAIAAGECIVMPTDTVYGIGANAFSAEAVQRLLDAKGRGRDMPPPVLISEPAMLDALGVNVSTFARRLADRFWPGALTLVVEMQPSLRIDLGDTDGTIALRVPDHAAARTLLRRTGPLAVSSANVSGQPSATSIDDAIAQLGDSVSVYLDAGPTPGPVPSTIIEFVSDPAGAVLREGVLSYDTISDVAPLVARFVAEPAPEAATASEDSPEAPSSDGATSDGATSDAGSSSDSAGIADPVTDTPAEPSSAEAPERGGDWSGAPGDEPGTGEAERDTSEA